MIAGNTSLYPQRRLNLLISAILTVSGCYASGYEADSLTAGRNAPTAGKIISNIYSFKKQNMKINTIMLSSIIFFLLTACNSPETLVKK